MSFIKTRPDKYLFYNAIYNVPNVNYNNSIEAFKKKLNTNDKEIFQQRIDTYQACSSFPLLVYYIEHYMKISACPILNSFARSKDNDEYNIYNDTKTEISLDDVENFIIPAINTYIKKKTKQGGAFKIKNYKKSKNSYKNKKSKNSYKNKKSKNSYKNKKSKNSYKNKKSKNSYKNKKYKKCKKYSKLNKN